MKSATFAPVYAAIYPMLSERARECGYALAIHGTVCSQPGSDMDLLAFPWTESAVPAVELVKSFDEYFRTVLKWRTPTDGPEQKPHGRMAWSISTGNGGVIDLSVAPLIP